MTSTHWQQFTTVGCTTHSWHAWRQPCPSLPLIHAGWGAEPAFTLVLHTLLVPAPSPLALEAAEEFLRRWHKWTSRAALAVNMAPYGSRRNFRHGASASRAVASHYHPKSTVMATESFMSAKKWRLLARDRLGLNCANPVAKARLRQTESPVGPLSNFHLLQYPKSVRHTLSANLLQTLTLSRNQRNNPRIYSAPKAV